MGLILVRFLLKVFLLNCLPKKNNFEVVSSPHFRIHTRYISLQKRLICMVKVVGKYAVRPMEILRDQT